VIYDNFDAWPVLDQQTRRDVLASLLELRWIIGETGVMVIAVTKGGTPEIEEQFAGAEQVDWSMPELTPLYNGETTLDVERVQAWLDAAALEDGSPIRADGPELSALVAAAGDDIGAFSAMAEVAFGDAASRGVAVMDDVAIAAGLAERKNRAAD
jgi:hypothetical protein